MQIDRDGGPKVGLEEGDSALVRKGHALDLAHRGALGEFYAPLAEPAAVAELDDVTLAESFDEFDLDGGIEFDLDGGIEFELGLSPATADEDQVSRGRRSGSACAARSSHSAGASVLVGFGLDAGILDPNDHDAVASALAAWLPDVEVEACAGHDWVQDEWSRGTWPSSGRAS